MADTEPQARLFAAAPGNIFRHVGDRLWLKIPHTWARLLLEEDLISFLSNESYSNRDTYGYFYTSEDYERWRRYEHRRGALGDTPSSR